MMQPNYKLYEMMKSDGRFYQSQALISSEKLHYPKRKLRSIWSQVFHSLLNLFRPINEPVIEEIRDRNGVAKWQVYDPASDQKMTFYSREEVCIWLEQRR
jgi:hypothetical protein